ncbi:MAG: YihA family ribosome biogenesis GTP-binding protein [Deltaproteobacteria bacterium]|nr:YihA family ribosome biogenesis GTP-binding protein [Deltaproteobacteria bacterium]
MIKDAQFVRGALDLTQLPEAIMPEIAFVGRSNVGKSTFINRLTNRKKLAKTSSTPGRTREINYFEIRGDFEEIGEQKFFLVDLPGFGYAKMSKQLQKQIQNFMIDYIQNRDSLKVICLLNDIRRDPGEEELELRDFCFRNGKHLLVIVTKSDKVKRNDLKKRAKIISQRYHLEPEDLYLTGEKEATKSFWERVNPLLF